MKVIRGSSFRYIPASHENQKDPQVWKKVLLTFEDLVSGRIQMVNWAKLPVGKTFTAHYHEDMEEIFIILSGRVRFRGGKDEVELEKGDAVVVPPKIYHEMKNLVNHDVEYIVFGIAIGTVGRTVVV